MSVFLGINKWAHIFFIITKRYLLLFTAPIPECYQPPEQVTQNGTETRPTSAIRPSGAPRGIKWEEIQMDGSNNNKPQCPLHTVVLDCSQVGWVSTPCIDPDCFTSTHSLLNNVCYTSSYTTVYSCVLSRRSDYQSTIMDYGLCVCVCVSMSFAERNFWRENHAGHSEGISMLLFTWSLVLCARFDR